MARALLILMTVALAGSTISGSASASNSMGPSGARPLERVAPAPYTFRPSELETPIASPSAPWARDQIIDCAEGRRWREGDHPALRALPPPENPVLIVAGRLAVLETLTGIRSSQLDAWRAYTSALLAVMAPPPDIDINDASQKSQSPDPLGAQRKLADRMIARAAKAETLKSAIAELRTTLTSDQLGQLVAFAGFLQIPFWELPPDIRNGRRGQALPDFGGEMAPPPSMRGGQP
jgi:hypothetical protein